MLQQLRETHKTAYLKLCEIKDWKTALTHDEFHNHMIDFLQFTYQVVISTLPEDLPDEQLDIVKNWFGGEDKQLWNDVMLSHTATVQKLRDEMLEHQTQTKIAHINLKQAQDKLKQKDQELIELKAEEAKLRKQIKTLQASAIKVANQQQAEIDELQKRKVTNQPIGSILTFAYNVAEDYTHQNFVTWEAKLDAKFPLATKNAKLEAFNFGVQQLVHKTQLNTTWWALEAYGLALSLLHDQLKELQWEGQTLKFLEEALKLFSHDMTAGDVAGTVAKIFPNRAKEITAHYGEEQIQRHADAAMLVQQQPEDLMTMRPEPINGLLNLNDKLPYDTSNSSSPTNSLSCFIPQSDEEEKTPPRKKAKQGRTTNPSFGFTSRPEANPLFQRLKNQIARK